MKLEDGTEISSEQIEILNANGPYSMAIWRSGEVCVGNEEGLAGRSEYFIKLIQALCWTVQQTLSATTCKRVLE